MALFRKKKKEDFEDGFEEEDFDEDEERNFRKKRFKDLHPENKRKRREPPKPWGRKERILVLIILLLTAGISAYLLITSNGFSWLKSPNIDSIRFPKVKFEKTIIIER